MINNKKLSEIMSDSPTSLEEFSEFIKDLIKEFSQKEIIQKAGIDKNVLYRALHQQNITLDNYYKIKKAYQNQLTKKSEVDGVSPMPILGQIVEETKIKLLNFSQPTSVPVTSGLIDRWSPVFGYLNVSGTCYSGFVYVFTGKDIDDETCVNNQCLNRLVMIYPHEEDPAYGMIVCAENHYTLIHPRTRKIIYSIPKKNNIKWAKFVCIIPYSLVEGYQQDPMYEQNIQKLEKSFIEDLSKTKN